MKRVLFFIALLLVYQVAISQIMRSTQSVNTITGLENGSVSFADYDNDGDLDMLITGSDSMYNPKTELYQNTGTGLGYVQTSFSNLASSSADWGDFDNDGDEDLLLTGSSCKQKPTDEVGFWEINQLLHPLL
jgi:hypothetical protein